MKRPSSARVLRLGPHGPEMLRLGSLEAGAPEYEATAEARAAWETTKTMPESKPMWNNIPEHYRNALVQSDSLDYLRALPDASVPMFLFSPPYNLGNTSGGGESAARMGHYSITAPMNKRSGMGKWSPKTGSSWMDGRPGIADGYDGNTDSMPHAEYVAWQHTILTECWRALAPNGAIYYNHKPRILDGVLVEPRDYVPRDLTVRQRVIWARAGGINFSAAFYLPTYEEILIICKPAFRLKSKGASGAGDVWSIAQESNTWHPAPFPLALAERAIETVMPAFVVDPFAGSGTTARAAKRCGVGYSGCDLSAAYLEKARAAVDAERTLTHRQARIDDVLADQSSFLEAA